MKQAVVVYESITVLPVPTKYSLPTDSDAQRHFKEERERALEAINSLLATKRYTILKVVSLPLEGRGNSITEYHLGKIATLTTTVKPQNFEAEEFDEPERNEDGTLVGVPVEVMGKAEEGEHDGA